MNAKKFAAMGMIVAGWLAAAGPATAQEVMRISSWLPPSHVNTEIFPTWIKWIEEATEGRVTGVIERWRRHYNTVRPHSSLGYRPPAPETLVPMDQRPTMH